MKLHLHLKQAEVFNSPHRFRVVAAGRRWGKSVLAKTLMIKYASVPNRLVWYVAPSYRMAKQIMWPELLRSLPPALVARQNETLLRLELTNGSVIELKGADSPDCFDDQTEILTPEGWKFLKNLPEDLAVMTLNPETNVAEWQTPTRYVHQEYAGPMYHLGGKLDLLVTPEHRFLVDTRKGVRKFKTLDQIADQDRIPAQVKWEGFDSAKWTHDMLAFMGFYLAEGCARKDPGPKCSYEITFAQTKGVKGGDKGDVRAEFIEVLKRLGAPFKEHEDVIRVYGKEWWELVVGFGLAWEKRIPGYILDLPPEKLETLLKWMIAGDGCVRRGGIERVYYTTSKGMAGDVQELAMKIGFNANVSEKRQKQYSPLKDGRVIESKRPLYQVQICNNKQIHFRSSKKEYITEVKDFKGMVHCVEVPNQTVYVRRNGRPTWTGNSLRGVGIHFLVMDEVQDIFPDAWKKVLRPTLADTGGHALFIGSPKSYNFLYELYLIGQDAKNQAMGRWKSWQFPTITSPFIPRSEIEAARNDMDEKSFNQEFNASFSMMSGRVYYTFSRHEHVGKYPFNPALPIWIGQDFNIDPMSSVILQPQPSGEVWVVDEINLVSSNTEEVCKEIERRYWRYMNQIVMFPDPASGHKQHARGETDLDIFRENGFKRILHRAKHPPIADRVNAVNRMFRAADNSKRLFVNEKCLHLIESLEQTVYIAGTRDIDKKVSVEHMSDALGYCIEFQFPVRKVEIAGVSI